MKPKSVRDKALEEILGAKDIDELESLRIKYLGRRGILTLLFKQLREVPQNERKEIGESLNDAKNSIISAIENRKIGFIGKRAFESIDLSLPGRKSFSGSIHPLTRIENELVDTFIGMGFSVAYGYEVETEYYNFDALNTPPDHPARDIQDTFYLEDGRLLRTHTSPVQIRVMESGEPPFRIISPGRTYRVDAYDASHSPVFHQVEGLYVDKDVRMSDLFGTLELFAKKFFGEKTITKFVPSYFPFTEPSTEMQVSCPFCGGKGCTVCKYTGWVEILGAGIVHRKILANMKLDGYSGYAFGMGLERIAMLTLGISDIRLFYENEIQFLEEYR